MSLRWRAVREADLRECLAIDPRSMGDRIVGQESAFRIWRNLLHDLSFNSALVETEGGALPDKIVSFGSSIFLHSDYTDRELLCPRPDINSRVFAEIQGKTSIVRSVKSLTSQRHEDALDLLLLASSFQFSALSPSEQEEASILLPRSLVHLHVGYRIRRILMETTNERMRLLAISSGIWKMEAHFPTEERALMTVTREEALSSAGFMILAPLFHHKQPKLGLTDPQKQLLCQAIHGETDTDLAAQLGLSVSSIKKRWSTLYARIAQVLPELLPEHALEATSDSRGSQKRHRILTYTRDHPEELRPFRWYPTGNFSRSKFMLSALKSKPA